MPDTCTCCDQPATLSIILALDGLGRFYIPNQHVRAYPDQGPVREVLFCHPCMRTIENSLRATIASLIDVAQLRRSTRPQ